MNTYTEIEFPQTRLATFDVCELGRKKHHIHAFLELDVTEARHLIKRYRARTHQPLSFTAWLIKTISTTLQEFPQAHAYISRRRHAIIFHDIDITITIEREYEGTLVPLPYIIRRTNTKDWSEITQEIAQAKTQAITKDDTVLGHRQSTFATLVYYRLPGWMRRLVWSYLLRHPKLVQRQMGSVMITSIGMMGHVNGWFLYTSVHPLSFGIGAIIKKLGVVGKSIEIRDYLHITVLLDHDVIDGAPMARFITKLSENIESGFGLTAEK